MPHSKRKKATKQTRKKDQMRENRRTNKTNWQRTKRANETEQQKKIRLQANAARRRAKRDSETLAQKTVRLSKRREQYAAQPEEKKQKRRQQDALRKRKERASPQAMLKRKLKRREQKTQNMCGVFLVKNGWENFDENSVEPHYVGKMNVKCKHCGALHWEAEKLSKSTAKSGPLFGLCCMNGAIQIEPIPQPPDALLRLYLEKPFCYDLLCHLDSVKIEDEHDKHINMLARILLQKHGFKCEQMNRSDSSICLCEWLFPTSEKNESEGDDVSPPT
eukprot:152467_1